MTDMDGPGDKAPRSEGKTAPEAEAQADPLAAAQREAAELKDKPTPLSKRCSTASN